MSHENLNSYKAYNLRNIHITIFNFLNNIFESSKNLQVNIYYHNSDKGFKRTSSKLTSNKRPNRFYCSEIINIIDYYDYYYFHTSQYIISKSPMCHRIWASIKRNINKKKNRKFIGRKATTYTLRKLYFHFLSQWIGYDRGDKFWTKWKFHLVQKL